MGCELVGAIPHGGGLNGQWGWGESPAGHIGLGGRLAASVEKLPFVSPEQRRSRVSHSSPSSQPTTKEKWMEAAASQFYMNKGVCPQLGWGVGGGLGDDVTTLMFKTGSLCGTAGRFWRELFLHFNPGSLNA